MSLNIDYKRVSIICLLDKFKIGVDTSLLNWIVKQAKVIIKDKDKAS